MSDMFAAAERDHAYPVVVSGYRSFDEQVEIFAGAIERQRNGAEQVDMDEAVRRAARFIAPPGCSQHQLGTTADVSSWELGYALRGSFVETATGRWLIERAWEFGFIIPYTGAAEARTGYVTEPWHFRWVGRPLATFLWERNYLQSGYPTADDWLAELDSLLAERAAAPLSRV
jgi:D-alanyl-D-alanine carboxypeptidase